MASSASATHHRALALVLTTVLAIGVARLSGARSVAASAPPMQIAPAPDAETTTGPQRLDPNTADLHALQSLPGIGPALARRIEAARREGTVFRHPEDLRRVRGIGPRLVERLTPHLSFASAPVDGGVEPPTDRR